LWGTFLGFLLAILYGYDAVDMGRGNSPFSV
jgi:hypothetical protein